MFDSWVQPFLCDQGPSIICIGRVVVVRNHCLFFPSISLCSTSASPQSFSFTFVCLTMRFALASFTAVVAATLALAQPHARALTLNPARETIPGVEDWSNLAAAPSPPTTNAKRFAMKLPPLAPRAPHRHPQRAAPHRLGSRVQAAPRAQSSPSPPVTQQCNILVKSAAEVFGFIAPMLNVFGEYGIFVPDQANALLVSFTYLPDSPSQLDFTAVNGLASAFPFVGGVVGFASTDDNFGPGSYNYAYIAGTEQIPAGPAVLRDSTFGTATGVPTDSESAIWVYDPKTQAITPQWINTDGSAPATSIIYANDFNQALLLTGDAPTLRETFGADYPDVTFTCVPPMVAPSRN
ncbi:hypothetical protein FS749_016564 [Ceratobasidium sp. UAMH 11750]|nr:hypothetical protein FS749_016564 [Ceratobasidium sp. UAMH 11750]